MIEKDEQRTYPAPTAPILEEDDDNNEYNRKESIFSKIKYYLLNGLKLVGIIGASFAIGVLCGRDTIQNKSIISNFNDTTPDNDEFGNLPCLSTHHMTYYDCEFGAVNATDMISLGLNTPGDKAIIDGYEWEMKEYDYSNPWDKIEDIDRHRLMREMISRKDGISKKSCIYSKFWGPGINGFTLTTETPKRILIEPPKPTPDCYYSSDPSYTVVESEGYCIPVDSPCIIQNIGQSAKIVVIP